MIKIYSMPSCPDCRNVEEQIAGLDGYEVIDIGSHVRLLKEFLRLRDSSPAFDDARRGGFIGIPCFVLEDGRITLKPEEAGLKSREADAADTSSASSDPSGTGPDAGFSEGAACSLDGKGC